MNLVIFLVGLVIIIGILFGLEWFYARLGQVGRIIFLSLNGLFCLIRMILDLVQFHWADADWSAIALGLWIGLIARQLRISEVSS